MPLQRYNLQTLARQRGYCRPSYRSERFRDCLVEQEHQCCQIHRQSSISIMRRYGQLDIMVGRLGDGVLQSGTRLDDYIYRHGLHPIRIDVVGLSEFSVFAICCSSTTLPFGHKLYVPETVKKPESSYSALRFVALSVLDKVAQFMRCDELYALVR